MKVILSRKGFDSEYGSYPSPVLPDGRMISLPIPSKIDSITYNELKLDEQKTYYDLIKDLGMQGFDSDEKCHLDPDVYKRIIKRKKAWKPLFGQIGAAATHLYNKNICEGDLFLFFGWFRKTRIKNKKLEFYGSDFHAIFGYMQVGKLIKKYSEFPEWMSYHPHANLERKINETNIIFVARDSLSWNENLAGAGPFYFNENLLLTEKGFSKSKWNLNPNIFKGIQITYHPDPWKNGYFQSTARGQEFVIQEDKNVEGWAMKLINQSIKF